MKKKKVFNPLYFIGQAFVSFWRNRVMSIAAILVLASCLIILGAFAILVNNLNVNIEKLGHLNEIVVFVDYDLTQSEVDDISADIVALENVTYVEYVSKKEGLDQMRETYSDYQTLFDDIEANGDNPLADSFIVTYQDTSKVYELEAAIHAIPGVSKVNNRIDYALKVENFKNGMSFVFVWFFILLFAVSVFVIFNTIRIAVQGRKEEIDIERYIGASKGFIVTPFIIEGLIIGGVSAAGAFIAVNAIYKWVLKATTSELQMIEFLPAKTFAVPMILAFLGIGIGAGVLTSIFSLRKNLNN